MPVHWPSLGFLDCDRLLNERSVIYGRTCFSQYFILSPLDFWSCSGKDGRLSGSGRSGCARCCRSACLGSNSPSGSFLLVADSESWAKRAYKHSKRASTGRRSTRIGVVRTLRSFIEIESFRTINEVGTNLRKMLASIISPKITRPHD
jgi:hypothetical protein